MITGIVLAGGSSRRMGREKALLPFKGRPIIQHVVVALENVCGEIIIVAQPGQDFSFLEKRVVHDAVPGYGALMGLYTGIKEARTRNVLVAAARPCAPNRRHSGGRDHRGAREDGGPAPGGFYLWPAGTAGFSEVGIHYPEGKDNAAGARGRAGWRIQPAA